VIDQQDVQRVHDAAVRLLADVGCDILDAEALALLAAHGAAVDGARARFGEELVREALSTAPGTGKQTARPT